MYSKKFKNLVLYILSSRDYYDQGIKKLNKFLYFVDFYFYREKECFISDVKYAKAKRGPIIDGYKEIFNEMCKDKVLERIDKSGCIYYKPLKKFDISEFSSDEIEHIHNLLGRYGKLSSAELESISHEQQPWILTESDGDIIDPDLSLLIEIEPVKEEIDIRDKRLKDELIELANSV